MIYKHVSSADFANLSIPLDEFFDKKT